MKHQLVKRHHLWWGNAVLAAVQRGFAAELPRLGIAADARNAQHAVNDLNPEHP